MAGLVQQAARTYLLLPGEVLSLQFKERPLAVSFYRKIGLFDISLLLGCPNRTEPRPNRNKNSEKPKPQTAIFSQNHGLQFFARNSAQKWSKLLNFEKVHNFPLNCYPLSSLLNAQGD